MSRTYSEMLEGSLKIMSDTLIFWRDTAPDLGIQKDVCQQEALACELSMLNMIDDSLL
jgi:hypothetical protein